MSLRIALAGNPNSGKTTLFNALTGSTQYVGNWPGVTVEKKEGKYKKQKDVIITDLPGIYSLSPYTLEEVVARNYLLKEKPDAILNIVDATNLERNLYLTTQCMELGIPVVIALNMMDIIEKNGDHINVKKLSDKLGVEIVEISALKGTGVDKAAEAAISAANKKIAPAAPKFSGEVEQVLDSLRPVLSGVPADKQRWYEIKVFERDEKIGDQITYDKAAAEKIIAAAEAKMDDDSESIITNERYEFITGLLEGSYEKKNAGNMTISDKIDRVVTNRWLAIPIFLLVMWVVYFLAINTVGTMGTDWVNDVLFGEIVPGAVGGFLESIGTAEWLQGLILDGIVAGVGAVLGFLPQMIVLFICLAFLEGCGYMARIAFIMDRIFRRFGLSGKSFIPMMVGTGCGVPGVMASRTIENERDRRMTIMTTTFIPCGAKLPIIGLIAGALFGNSALIGWSAYVVGIAAIVISGIILKKTKMFAGDPAPFVMELPAYHIPTFSSVFHSVWERASSFVKKAGTVILLATILVWFMSSFGFYEGAFQMLPEEDFMEHSILAALGNTVAWIFAPLGWGSWKPAVAAVTGLIAKENVVGTFGILYKYGEVSEMGEEIWANLQAEMSALAGYSFLVFNLLCAPCFAAIGAIKREMNNAKWTWFAIGYQCGFAYLASLCIYQIGSAVTGNMNIIGLIVSLVVLGGTLYMLFKPYKESTTLKADAAKI
ncbi:MAG: ferrous iron transport protein B [Lachnospiraceae bacterium]|nr:ferrous iron transport protein B [Lachnospiraceae bacterium]